MRKSVRILAILYSLLCPDPAQTLFTSRNPISHPGTNAKPATISPSDPTMRFQFKGKAKITQGSGHLVTTMLLVQGSIVALEGIGAAKVTIDEVEERNPQDANPGYEDSRRLSFLQLLDNAEAMYNQVFNLDAAAGMATILQQAVKAGFTAHSANFQDGLDSREAFQKQLIPIPLYSPNLVMKIHRMRQRPFRTKIGWMEGHTPYPYLMATRQPHSVFTAITQETFDRCYPANDFLVCPALDKLYKPNRVTEGQHAARCIYALKRKWEEDVEKHRALIGIKEEEDARQIAHNQFAVFANKPATVEIACTDDSTDSMRISDGLHLITLPMSCVAETSALFRQPFVDVEAGTETRDDSVRVPPAVIRVSNATNTLKKNKSELAAIKTNLPPTPTLDWLTEHIDSIGQVELDNSTWAVIRLVWFIITAGIVISTGVKCKKRNKCKQEQRQPMGGPTNTINLGYPAMPPPRTPYRPPNYAYPKNGPSFNPACSQPQAQHNTLSRTQSYLNLLKQAETVKL